MFVEGEKSDEEALLKYMRTKMPQYMIPAKIYYLTPFPLNGNSKTDKVKLKSMIEI